MHTYNNGVKMNDDCVLRKENIINYHEPIEELIVIEILKNSGCDTMVDVGCSYGYYLLLGAKYGYHVIGFEKQEKRSKRIPEQLVLNNVKNYVIYDKECTAKDINYLDTKGTFLMMDIQGAETRILKNSNLSCYEHILVGTHNMGKVDTHKEIIQILKNANYRIKCEIEPGKVNFQPDGIVWGVK